MTPDTLLVFIFNIKLCRDTPQYVLVILDGRIIFQRIVRHSHVRAESEILPSISQN